ncbi:endo-1,4-beta-xylanase [Cellulomonas sp. URHB0016]
MKRPRILETIGVGVSAAALVIAPIAGVALAAPAAAADTVVLSNDFEGASVAPWGPRGPVTLAVTAADAHAGAQSLSVSGRTADWHGAATSVASLLAEGTPYTVSAWVKLAPGTTGSSGMHFTVQETSAAGDAYTWVGSPAATTADGWTQITGTYTKPAGLTAATLYVEAANIGSTPPNYLVDDVLVTGTDVPPVDPSVVPGGAVDPVLTPSVAARGTGNVAALTFDDGPNGATTTALLDYLKLNGLHATFCVIGQNIQAEGGADILKRIVADGHTLCNHSIDYADMGSLTLEQAQDRMKQNLGIIRDALGDPNAPVPFFRAPNGSWGSNIAAAAVSLGMQPLGVTNTISDWETQDVDTLTANLRTAMKAGQIVLTHDGGGDRTGTLTAVKTVVDERLAAGWTFSLPVGGPADDGGSTGVSTLTNDFETDLGAWGARGDGTNPVISLSTTEHHGGAQSASVADRTQGWHGLGASVTGIFTTGRTYNISAWVKLADSETDPADIRLSIQRDNAGTSSYDTVATATGVTSGAWVQISTSYTMAAAETALLYFESASGTPSFLVDDVVVTGNSAPPVQTDIPSLQDTVPWPLGVAIDSRETTGAGEQLVSKHYNQLTPENDMKPEEIQPTEGTFTFGDADALVDYAIAHGTRVHGHTLVWHSQTPAWFFEHTDGTPLTNSADDQALLLQRMKTHIDTVADHFREKYGEYGTAGNPIVSFDVVNEVIDESQDDGMRRSPWYNVLGAGFVNKAFEYASDAFNGGDTTDPAVKLFINDYNTEQPAKRQAMFTLLQDLIAHDVPVDGIGNQFHLSMSTSIASLKATLDLFGTLPLLQNVSELDVAVDGAITQNKLVQQGYYYQNLFDLLRQYPDLFAVTIWGPYDSRSWRSEGAPLPFNGDLQAKPAFWGIADGSQLPTLTLTALAHAGDPVGTDAHDWSLLPNTQVGTGGSGFQVRWSADHLTAYVHVDDATNDGAGDKVALFTAGGSAVTVDRTGAGGTVAEVEGGYDVVATIPATGLAQGGTAQFDVRITDGGTGASVSWNDLTHHQEDGARLGALDLVEAVGYLAVPQVETAPTVDGDIDAVWADAPVVSTDTLVEGAAEGAKAKVRALWTDDALHLLYEVSDPTLDATSSNAWEQDSVETFLDPVNAKNGSYLPNDGQYRVNFENFQSVSGDLTVIGDRLTSATKVVDGGYVVEESIAFGHTAAVGDLTGVDFQVNDGTAGVRTAVHSWTDPTGRSYQNTTRWGVAELVGPLAPPVAAPQITQQPQSVSGAFGSEATLTAAASGQPEPTVQWQVLTDGWLWTHKWKDVAGATSPSLTVPLDAKHDGATYRAVFTNSEGSATTDKATVTVAKAKPVVTTQPQSVSGAVGSTVKLTAAASGYPVPTVRWEQSSGGSSHWRPVGTGSTTLSVKVSGKPDGDQYRAVFTNKLGSATSQVATVTVATSAPAITSQPKDVTVKVKATAKFTVGVSGYPEPKVQWYQQAKGSTTWTKVPGATSTTLSVVAQANADGTHYRAVATSTAGTATSATVTLRVIRS